MDAFEALRSATAEFERQLRLVGPADWTRPTPCEAWDVRALVNHVVGANRRYTMLLDGASAAEVDATRQIDHLGDDAVGAFLQTATEMRDAFTRPGALRFVAHHPVGHRSGAELLDMRVLDVAVHAWDLAVAISADETLAADLIESVLLTLDIDAGRQHGSFAAPDGEVPADSAPQTRLLHLVGRKPTRIEETK